MIFIVFLVGCNKKVVIDPVVSESVVTEPDSFIIYSTCTKEDFKFNDIVIDSSLTYFTQQLLADGFKINKTWIDSEKNKDDSYNIAAFTSNKYNDLFGVPCRIFVYESIYTGKVCKVKISTSMKPKNDDYIISVLKEKYGSFESRYEINKHNLDGKCDFNEKFVIFSSYFEDEKLLKITWSTDANGVSGEALVFVADPFSTEIEYLNPINYYRHDIESWLISKNNYKKAKEKAKEIL